MRIDCQCLDSGTAQVAEDHIHLVPRRIDALYVVDNVFEGAVGHVDTVDAQQLIAHGEAGFDLAVGLSVLGQIVDAGALQVVADGGEDDPQRLAQPDPDEGLHVFHKQFPLELVLPRSIIDTPRRWQDRNIGGRSARVLIIAHFS